MHRDPTSASPRDNQDNLGPPGNMTALTHRAVTLAECATSVASCTAAGYTCTTASLSTAAWPCPLGSYSRTGATSCTACSVGTDADATGTAVCAPCPGGRYRNTLGLTSPMCTDVCPAGWYGTSGSNSSACSGPCDAGRWGGMEQNNSQCSGACSVGYVLLAPFDPSRFACMLPEPPKPLMRVAVHGFVPPHAGTSVPRDQPQPHR
jgi:hypothetical protein